MAPSSVHPRRLTFLKHPTERLDPTHLAGHTQELEVDRRDVSDAQALSHGDDHRVHVPERRCCKLGAQLNSSLTVFHDRIDDQEVAVSTGQCFQEPDFQRGPVAELVTQKVAGFDQHWLRYEQPTGPTRQQPDALAMVAILDVVGGDQRAGVAEQGPHALCLMDSMASMISRSRRASAMISRYRLDRSGSSMLAKPTHGKRLRNASMSIGSSALFTQLNLAQARLWRRQTPEATPPARLGDNPGVAVTLRHEGMTW